MPPETCCSLFVEMFHESILKPINVNNRYICKNCFSVTII